jgi:hypothetical protein
MRLYSDNGIDTAQTNSSTPTIVDDSLASRYSADPLASAVAGCCAASVGYVADSPEPTPHWTVHPHQPRGEARLDVLETPCCIATGSSHLHGLHRRSVFAVIDRDFNDNGSINSDLYEMRRIFRECLRVCCRSSICDTIR